MSKSLYPQVFDSNPDSSSPFVSNPSKTPSSGSSLYPTIDMNDLAENLFPDKEDEAAQRIPDSEHPAAFESSEEVIIRIPGCIVHLIDKERSIELASGEFTIVQLKQDNNVVAILARVGEEIQWPLAKDEAAVKLDESHYFFNLRTPAEADSDDEGEIRVDSSENMLNYGITIASKGQERLLKELDGVLEKYSAFRVEKVEKGVAEGWGVMAKDVSPAEMEKKEKKDAVEKSSAAYWTTLAPNVEDYSGSVARMIAAGSGHLVRGILWCGDVAVDRLNWGHEFLMKRMGKGTSSEISPAAMRRMKRVKKMTKMSEKVATGILSGVVKVSGFFTSSIANSKAGQKFFSLLPGEIVLASLDGFRNDDSSDEDQPPNPEDIVDVDSLPPEQGPSVSNLPALPAPEAPMADRASAYQALFSKPKKPAGSRSTSRSVGGRQHVPTTKTVISSTAEGSGKKKAPPPPPSPKKAQKRPAEDPLSGSKAKRVKLELECAISDSVAHGQIPVHAWVDQVIPPRDQRLMEGEKIEDLFEAVELVAFKASALSNELRKRHRVLEDENKVLRAREVKAREAEEEHEVALAKSKSLLDAAIRERDDALASLQIEQKARKAAEENVSAAVARYKSSPAFQADARASTRDIIPQLGEEWFETDEGSRRLVKEGKAAYWLGMVAKQKEIYDALYARDEDFSPAAYGLEELLGKDPPPTPRSEDEDAEGEDERVQTPATEGREQGSEDLQQIPLDHAYLNSSANLQTLATMGGANSGGAGSALGTPTKASLVLAGLDDDDTADLTTLARRRRQPEDLDKAAAEGTGGQQEG